MLQSIPIQEISSAAIWVPLIWAGLRLKAGDRKLRLFFVFLVFGALVDGLGWYLYLNQQSFFVHTFFQFFYLWFEALFFAWLAFQFLNFGKRKFWKFTVPLLIHMLFLTEGVNKFLWTTPNGDITEFVHAFILIQSSFLMAFALLRMAEMQEEIMKNPWFWILSGIFFYCFGTFFIDLLSFTDFGPQLWGFRNSVNIIQYVFFVVGLARMGKAKEILPISGRM
jgi:hypothetical protein